MDSVVIPQIIDEDISIEKQYPFLSEKEVSFIIEAKKLFSIQMYSYSLVGIWNAAVSNLRRKVEAYGVDLWQAVVKTESGRSRYDKDADSLSERWAEVDDYVLIEGAGRLGLMDAKALKALEMINWMRNHASSAHDSECVVGMEDVAALALLLDKNLFQCPLPDPKHSVGAIFEPVKNNELGGDELNQLEESIRSLDQKDLRTAFGFLLDLVVKGNDPALTNALHLFPVLWDRAPEDLRKTLGLKYHTSFLDASGDEAADKALRTRLYELIIRLKAVRYIPDGTRARLFRRAAEQLARAKDSMYGWGIEVSASKNLLQLGTSIPSTVFEYVYSEILSVWCGNFWGHSDSHNYLLPFIDCLGSEQLLKLADLFRTSERVQEELHQSRPQSVALSLLNSIREKLTVEAHKARVDAIMEHVRSL